jgi:hypothetical protein
MTGVWLDSTERTCPLSVDDSLSNSSNLPQWQILLPIRMNDQESQKRNEICERWGVNMRIESHEIADGLHVQDESRLTPRVHGFESGPQQAGTQAAKLTEMAAPVAKERPDELRQCEHVLTMRYRGEQVLLQPLTVGEHALLMAARAEAVGRCRRPEVARPCAWSYRPCSLAPVTRLRRTSDGHRRPPGKLVSFN